MIHDLVRYQFDDKSSLPRETVLLVSLGCSYGKCSFCDYQEDKSSSVLACDTVNRKVLSNVRGMETGSSCLDVTCSASYTELPFTTMNYIRKTCKEKKIGTVVLEGHYIFREANIFYSDFFNSHDIEVIFRCGVETFDDHMREDILKKGLRNVTPQDISRHFQWINLMYGMEGQSPSQLKRDIDIGLKLFKRINLSIYTTVPGGPERNESGIKEFYESSYYQELLRNPSIDIFDEWDEENGHSVGHDINI